MAVTMTLRHDEEIKIGDNIRMRARLRAYQGRAAIEVVVSRAEKLAEDSCDIVDKGSSLELAEDLRVTVDASRDHPGRVRVKIEERPRYLVSRN